MDSAKMNTPPTFPPNNLLQWARKQNLLPSIEFESEEDFRQRVYSCLDSVQQKIDEVGSVNHYWDIEYSGNKITSRRPKKEKDIQRTIQGLLLDQMLMASIEIVPEYQTGAGNLDFMFLANIKNKGISRICVEFKPAHSQDLIHGFEVQLPAYMRNKGAQYGAYCVLWFSGDWFDKPNGTINDIYVELSKRQLRYSADPLVKKVAIYILDFTKGASASVR